MSSKPCGREKKSNKPCGRNLRPDKPCGRNLRPDKPCGRNLRPDKPCGREKKPITSTIRPLGHITLDMEPLILEMVECHDLQVGEILNLVYGYLQIHCPGAFEVYESDESKPIMYYGPRNNKF